uniref:Uncharacterized protein n=1 Tax=Cyclopterus lumpus TaxID=8103 RepID=A0A8C3AW45_CYCLU
MVREDCPAGTKWDSLVVACVVSESETRPGPEMPPVGRVRSTDPPAQAHSVMLLSPALWIFVMLATLGSILALALWFIIYKRQTRHNQCCQPDYDHHLNPEAAPLNGPAERSQRATWAPPPCPHLHLQAQTGTTWEEGFTACSDLAKHAGTEGVRGLPTFGTREHRIPLPATELGGTVLVTTKTV